MLSLKVKDSLINLTSNKQETLKLRHSYLLKHVLLKKAAIN